MAKPDYSLMDISIDPANFGEPLPVYYDAEFTDMSHDADLLSVGLVAAGSTADLYIEISDAKLWACSDFVKTEVMPFFGRHNPEVLTRAQAVVGIETVLDELCGGHRQRQIHLAADSSWDWQLIINLYTAPPGQPSWATSPATCSWLCCRLRKRPVSGARPTQRTI